MQLVLIGNRIVAHGANFLSMGGVVINTETGKSYENATVAECEGCPSDIDQRGYEYHAGTFVPCAPYGKGDGNLAVVCGEDCKAVKDSGIPLSFVKACRRAYSGTHTGNGKNSATLSTELPVTPSLMIIGGGGCLTILCGGVGFSINDTLNNAGTNIDYGDCILSTRPTWTLDSGSNGNRICNGQNMKYSFVAFE